MNQIISIGQSFNDAKEISTLLRDIQLGLKKSIKLNPKKKGGTMREWICSDAENCKFRVLAYRSRGEERQWVIKVIEKFCSLHLAMNVNARFRLNEKEKKSMRRHIFALQGSQSVLQYENTLKAIQRDHPKSRIIRSPLGEEVQQSVTDYLSQVHPTSWVQFANLSPTEEEVRYIDAQWESTLSYGEPKPLFGIRTNNGVEGENNANIWNNLRQGTIFEALTTYINRFNEVCGRRLEIRWP